jgi:hypothetical protein
VVGGAVVLAVGGTAAGAVKLSPQDVERIEEHTGVSAEELTDEELQGAMQELGIESMPLDEQDQAALAAE